MNDMDQPRDRLPERTEIENCFDMEDLLDWREAAEWGMNKIEVDLEFLVDAEDDWRARALSALTAHRICLKHTERRIDKLKYEAAKGNKPEDFTARLIDRTSWLSKFHQVATQQLDAKSLERIIQHTNKSVQTAIIKELGV